MKAKFEAIGKDITKNPIVMIGVGCIVLGTVVVVGTTAVKAVRK